MRMKPPKNRALSPAVGRAIDRKLGRTRAESVRLFLRQFYASSPTTELQRALTFNVVCAMRQSFSAQATVNEWAAAHAEEIPKTQAILTRLRAEPKPGYAMFSVVLREMLNLAQSTSYKQ